MHMANNSVDFLFFVSWIMARFRTALLKEEDLVTTTESLLCFAQLALWLHYLNHKSRGHLQLP